MTNKHINDFNSSEIMRSFEQLAQERGLIKQDPILKKASTQKVVIDLTPADNLMENVLKLANALRANQLSSEAQELEDNFLLYKKAQTMYDCTNETGEDFLHSAHPKGSHKLDGLDSPEAVVEDLLDKHLKILKKVEKHPTGKLTEASSILNAVKIALGQDDKKQQLLSAINAKLAIVKKKVSFVFDKAEPELTISIGTYKTLFEEYTSEITKDNLLRLKSLIPAIRQRIKPGALSGITEDTWGMISNQLDECMPLLDETIQLRDQYLGIKREENSGYLHQEPNKDVAAKNTVPQESANVKKYKDLLQQMKSSLNSLKFTVDSSPTLQSPAEKQKVDSFIDGTFGYLDKDIEQKFNEAADKESAATGLLVSLEKANAQIEAFRKQVVK